MMALVAFPLLILASGSPVSQDRGRRDGRPEPAFDSLMMMKERVRIANELLRAASGVLGEQPAESVLPAEDAAPAPGRSTDPTSKGEYIWIPDSLLADWNTFLDEHKGFDLPALSQRGLTLGRDSLVKVPQVIAPVRSPYESYYVTFRGDTIPRVLKDRKLGRFDRGLFNYLYIPKGIWSFGLTASYGELNTKDIEMLGLVTGMTLRGNIFSISPSMQYFIRNNLAVGLRFSYTRGSAGVTSLNLEIDEDMAFNINDIHYELENYKAAVTLRQYLGVEPSARFGVFNEVELAFASGSSNFKRPYDGEIRRLHSTSMEAQLNFSPGVSIFIMKNVGFNVSFGVFGFSLKNEKQFLNNEYQGSRFTSGANFRFNIFNINFGLAVTL